MAESWNLILRRDSDPPLYSTSRQIYNVHTAAIAWNRSGTNPYDPAGTASNQPYDPYIPAGGAAPGPSASGPAGGVARQGDSRVSHASRGYFRRPISSPKQHVPHLPMAMKRVHQTAALQAEIDSTVGIMRDNIYKVTERGENLNNLQDKTGKSEVSP
jgi:hypothetical protein